MDCRTARLLLNFAYPCRTELEGSEAEDLESHLAECVPCGAVAQAERRADNRIGQAMRAVPVPDGLRTRLLTQLDAERDAWYRRGVRRGLEVFAAAAVLLLAVWIVYTVQKSRPVPPDIPAMADRFQGDILNPSPDLIEQRFKTAAPPESEWNYRRLVYATLADFQGKSVPLLIFAHGDDQARLYILSQKDFDLSGLETGSPIPGSGYKIEVELKPGYAYVIFYTGESLKPFKPQRPA
jgi:hypothetical protein